MMLNKIKKYQILIGLLSFVLMIEFLFLFGGEWGMFKGELELRNLTVNITGSQAVGQNNAEMGIPFALISNGKRIPIPYLLPPLNCSTEEASIKLSDTMQPTSSGYVGYSSYRPNPESANSSYHDPETISFPTIYRQYWNNLSIFTKEKYLSYPDHTQSYYREGNEIVYSGGMAAILCQSSDFLNADVTRYLGRHLEARRTNDQFIYNPEEGSCSVIWKRGLAQGYALNLNAQYTNENECVPENWSAGYINMDESCFLGLSGGNLLSQKMTITEKKLQNCNEMLKIHCVCSGTETTGWQWNGSVCAHLPESDRQAIENGGRCAGGATPIIGRPAEDENLQELRDRIYNILTTLYRRSGGFVNYPEIFRELFSESEIETFTRDLLNIAGSTLITDDLIREQLDGIEEVEELNAILTQLTERIATNLNGITTDLQIPVRGILENTAGGGEIPEEQSNLSIMRQQTPEDLLALYDRLNADPYILLRVNLFLLAGTINGLNTYGTVNLANLLLMAENASFSPVNLERRLSIMNEWDLQERPVAFRAALFEVFGDAISREASATIGERMQNIAPIINSIVNITDILSPNSVPVLGFIYIEAFRLENELREQLFNLFTNTPRLAPEIVREVLTSPATALNVPIISGNLLISARVQELLNLMNGNQLTILENTLRDRLTQEIQNLNQPMEDSNILPVERAAILNPDNLPQYNLATFLATQPTANLVNILYELKQLQIPENPWQYTIEEDRRIGDIGQAEHQRLFPNPRTNIPSPAADCNCQTETIWLNAVNNETLYRNFLRFIAGRINNRGELAPFLHPRLEQEGLGAVPENEYYFRHDSDTYQNVVLPAMYEYAQRNPRIDQNNVLVLERSFYNNLNVELRRAEARLSNNTLPQTPPPETVQDWRDWLWGEDSEENTPVVTAQDPLTRARQALEDCLRNCQRPQGDETSWFFNQLIDQAKAETLPLCPNCLASSEAVQILEAQVETLEMLINLAREAQMDEESIRYFEDQKLAAQEDLSKLNQLKQECETWVAELKTNNECQDTVSRGKSRTQKEDPRCKGDCKINNYQAALKSVYEPLETIQRQARSVILPALNQKTNGHIGEGLEIITARVKNLAGGYNSLPEFSPVLKCLADYNQANLENKCPRGDPCAACQDTEYFGEILRDVKQKYSDTMSELVKILIILADAPDNQSFVKNIPVLREIIDSLVQIMEPREKERQQIESELQNCKNKQARFEC